MSVSANLAAAIALHARDDIFLAPGPDKEIVGQLLQTPQVVHPAANVGRYVRLGTASMVRFILDLGMRRGYARWRSRPTRPF